MPGTSGQKQTRRWQAGEGDGKRLVMETACANGTSVVTYQFYRLIGLMQFQWKSQTFFFFEDIDKQILKLG
jgi:hypothetical protein